MKYPSVKFVIANIIAFKVYKYKYYDLFSATAIKEGLSAIFLPKDLFHIRVKRHSGPAAGKGEPWEGSSAWQYLNVVREVIV